MATSVLYMAMALDGYIAGPNDEPGNPGGDGFTRLHEWFVTPDGEFFRAGRAGRRVERRVERRRRGPRRTADRGAGRSLGRRSSRIGCADLRAQSSAARPNGRELSVGDVHERWDRQRDGAGEGSRRGPPCSCAWRVHSATGARGRGSGRGANESDPGAVRWWPSAVRGVAVARRAGDRSGDRHGGGHPHSLPRSPLSRSTMKQLPGPLRVNLAAWLVAAVGIGATFVSAPDPRQGQVPTHPGKPSARPSRFS